MDTTMLLWCPGQTDFALARRSCWSHYSFYYTCTCYQDHENAGTHCVEYHAVVTMIKRHWSDNDIVRIVYSDNHLENAITLPDKIPSTVTSMLLQKKLIQARWYWELLRIFFECADLSRKTIVEEMAMKIAVVLTLFYAACCQVPSL
jgi:hypothetical protein